MTKRVRVEAPAEEELTAATTWYDAQRFDLGREFVAAIEKAIAAIAEAPARLPLVADVPPDLGVRRGLVRGFPYAVVFLEQPDVIRILAIAHERRRPGYWRGRLPPRRR